MISDEFSEVKTLKVVDSIEHKSNTKTPPSTKQFFNRRKPFVWTSNSSKRLQPDQGRSNFSSTSSCKLSNIDASQLTIRTTHSPKKIPRNEDLKFGQTFSDHMLVVDWDESAGWSAPLIKPYSTIEIDPSSSVLHYATTCFEGMKAYKSHDGQIRLFRPEMNMNRLNLSAHRLAFPSFDGKNLVECIKRLIKLDSDWIPTQAGHSLYIRPTMIGSSAGLGVGKAGSITLFVICSPVGPYYPKGFKPISLLATTKYCRAWPGGSGGFKLGANYPTGILAQTEANQQGFDQILWLFGDDDHITEVGTMNIFIVLENSDKTIEIVTPPLDDKILPGVTRDSTISLIRSHIDGSRTLKGLPDRGLLELSERNISMAELVSRSRQDQVKEIFGTGTAAIVSTVESIGYKNEILKIPVGSNGLGEFSGVVQDQILGIQTGQIESDWSILVK
ncbi:aminotransferase [Phakopsora pachyrhizi]|nr:aminotransferase [Phakopsora pachyrhizi]